MRATTALLMTGILAVPAASWAQNCTNDARQVVSAIYRQVLERNPNGNEAAQWVNQLSGGQTPVRALMQSIAESTEHRNRFLPGESEGSRRQAVTILYKHILGREPDAGGLQAHTAAATRSGIDTVMSSLFS